MCGEEWSEMKCKEKDGGNVLNANVFKAKEV